MENEIIENNELTEKQAVSDAETEKKLKRRFISGIIIGAFCAMFIFVAGTICFILVTGARAGGRDEQGILNSNTIRKVKLLEGLVDTNYYKDDVDKTAEVEGMYKGLIDSLGDPYSVYYTEDELKELKAVTKGVYYGIGAYFGMDKERNIPMITGVMEGGPADEAGLMEGDVIYEVNKESTQGLSLDEVVAKIKGEKGTSVHLTLIREGQADNVEVDVTRNEIQVPTVSTELLKDGIGYLKITEFDEITTDQFTEGLAELRASNIKGLIIDLRNNPGGNLMTVCDIARQILPKGKIVYTVDRDGNKQDYTCDGSHQIDIPVVVLINQYSASASEILAGAIKDYGIGKLVGVTTFGKGIVQSVFDLNDGTAVKLTVSDYYTPKGFNIHKIGIEPDVEIELDVDKAQNEKIDTQKDKAVEVMKELLDK